MTACTSHLFRFPSSQLWANAQSMMLFVLADVSDRSIALVFGMVPNLSLSALCTLLVNV